MQDTLFTIQEKKENSWHSSLSFVLELAKYPIRHWKHILIFGLLLRQSVNADINADKKNQNGITHHSPTSDTNMIGTMPMGPHLDLLDESYKNDNYATELLKAAGIDPLPYYQYKAETFMKENDYRNVIHWAEKTRELDPLDEMALYHLSWSYFRLKEHKLFEEYASKMNDIKLETPEGILIRGMRRCYVADTTHDLNLYKKGIKDLDDANAADPTNNNFNAILNRFHDHYQQKFKPSYDFTRLDNEYAIELTPKEIHTLSSHNGAIFSVNEINEASKLGFGLIKKSYTIHGATTPSQVVLFRDGEAYHAYQLQSLRENIYLKKSGKKFSMPNNADIEQLNKEIIAILTPDRVVINNPQKLNDILLKTQNNHPPKENWPSYLSFMEGPLENLIFYKRLFAVPIFFLFVYLYKKDYERTTQQHNGSDLITFLNNPLSKNLFKKEWVLTNNHISINISDLFSTFEIKNKKYSLEGKQQLAKKIILAELTAFFKQDVRWNSSRLAIRVDLATKPEKNQLDALFEKIITDITYELDMEKMALSKKEQELQLLAQCKNSQEEYTQLVLGIDRKIQETAPGIIQIKNNMTTSPLNQNNPAIKEEANSIKWINDATGYKISATKSTLKDFEKNSKVRENAQSIIHLCTEIQEQIKQYINTISDLQSKKSNPGNFNFENPQDEIDARTKDINDLKNKFKVLDNAMLILKKNSDSLSDAQEKLNNIILIAIKSKSSKTTDDFTHNDKVISTSLDLENTQKRQNPVETKEQKAARIAAFKERQKQEKDNQKQLKAEQGKVKTQELTRPQKNSGQSGAPTFFKQSSSKNNHQALTSETKNQAEETLFAAHSNKTPEQNDLAKYLSLLLTAASRVDDIHKKIQKNEPGYDIKNPADGMILTHALSKNMFVIFKALTACFDKENILNSMRNRSMHVGIMPELDVFLGFAKIASENWMGAISALNKNEENFNLPAFEQEVKTSALFHYYENYRNSENHDVSLIVDAAFQSIESNMTHFQLILDSESEHLAKVIYDAAADCIMRIGTAAEHLKNVVKARYETLLQHKDVRTLLTLCKHDRWEIGHSADEENAAIRQVYECCQRLEEKKFSFLDAGSANRRPLHFPFYQEKTGSQPQSETNVAASKTEAILSLINQLENKDIHDSIMGVLVQFYQEPDNIHSNRTAIRRILQAGYTQTLQSAYDAAGMQNLLKCFLNNPALNVVDVETIRFAPLLNDDALMRIGETICNANVSNKLH